MMHHGKSVVARIADQRRSTRRAARNRSAVLAAAAVSMFVGGRAAQGATATWTGAAGDSLWATPGNWTGAAAGANTGAAGGSTDIAVFTTPGGTGNEVIPDANRNILGITFDIQSLGGGTSTSGRQIGLSGNTTPLYLTGGGTIQVNDGGVATSSSSINNPMVIVGNSYTFVNNASNTSVGLKPNGNITGGVAGNTTITFDGT